MSAESRNAGGVEAGLLWPGAGRAGDAMGDHAVVTAMVRVEEAWLRCLVEAGIAPTSAAVEAMPALLAGDVAHVAAQGESGGNPVIPLVGLLRSRLGDKNPEAARWLHRGLTSQDVLDTALMVGARDTVRLVQAELRAVTRSLTTLADRHRGTVMAARTLTQHAVPTTFAVKAATWLHGVLDAADDLAGLSFPVQVGGAAGTMAATVELAAGRGLLGPESSVAELIGAMAGRLDLEKRSLWHTDRAPVTRVGDALVRTTGALGRVANDVATLSRPEIGELTEGQGGGSSTMPHKANPVLSVLLRRAALAAPQLGATLHLAAAAAVDERPDGGWHAEWEPLRSLARLTLVAVRQGADLVAGLRVHPDRMRATHDAAADDLRAEQRTMAELAGASPREGYLGVADLLVDAALDRAHRHLDRHLDRHL